MHEECVCLPQVTGRPESIWKHSCKPVPLHRSGPSLPMAHGHQDNNDQFSSLTLCCWRWLIDVLTIPCSRDAAVGDLNDRLTPWLKLDPVRMLMPAGRVNLFTAKFNSSLLNSDLKGIQLWNNSFQGVLQRTGMAGEDSDKEVTFTAAWRNIKMLDWKMWCSSAPGALLCP